MLESYVQQESMLESRKEKKAQAISLTVKVQIANCCILNQRISTKTILRLKGSGKKKDFLKKKEKQGKRRGVNRTLDADD